jgi:YesN/AraC family two-component response regulator
MNTHLSKEELMEKVRLAMKLRYEENKTIRDIAKITGIKSPYLSFLFKLNLDENCIKNVDKAKQTKLRLEKIEKLLEEYKKDIKNSKEHINKLEKLVNDLKKNLL